MNTIIIILKHARNIIGIYRNLRHETLEPISTFTDINCFMENFIGTYEIQNIEHLKSNPLFLLTKNKIWARMR